MKIFRGLPQPKDRVDTAVAVGNFDGLHRGHLALIKELVEAAHEKALCPSVLTFEPHPREFFDPLSAPARILTLQDKIDVLQEAGIERIYIVEFNKDFADLSARDFVKQILVDGLHTRFICVGENFRFGSKRSGDFNTLVELGKEFHFEVRAVPMIYDEKGPISSSRVRQALACGDIQEVNSLLGRSYMLSGKVLHGNRLGTKLGFPTINQRILPPNSKTKPAIQGVYAVKVHGITPQPLDGMSSVGKRPTVTSNGEYLLETHIFNVNQVLYDEIVKVEFISKIRDEKKFNSLEELREAIEADAAKAKQILGLSD